MTPPLAEALLRSLIPAGELRESVLGDMTEGWQERATQGPSRANRWYWRQALASVPSLLVLWCRNASARSLLIVALMALTLRVIMLVLQYVAIALAAYFRPGPTDATTALAAVAGCVISAALCGWLVRRLLARTPGVAVVALCAACLLVQVDASLLVHFTMPTWLYWLTASPFSAIAVVIGATLSARPAASAKQWPRSH